MERKPDKSLDRLRSPSIRNKGGASRGRRDPISAPAGFRSQAGRSYDDDIMGMKFTELEGLDTVPQSSNRLHEEGSMEGGGLTTAKMLDGSFFNCFGDPFDESDMKPNQSAKMPPLNPSSHQPKKKPLLR